MDNLRELLKHAINEDAPSGDITVQTLMTTPITTNAQLIAKQSGIFFGNDIIKTIFELYDAQASINYHCKDGEAIPKNSLICSITANQATILLLERTLLNLCQRLSGIATLTHQFVTSLGNRNIHICDTRKTTPGLRFLEKAAVKAGGGTNHRFNLSDMILIKENHLQIMHQTNTLHLLSKKLSTIKTTYPHLKAEIEIESINQLNTLDLSACDIIMLDNFDIHLLKDAIKICRKKHAHAKIELSGNINLSSIKQYSSLDIDRISIGALTHSAPAFDISLLID